MSETMVAAVITQLCAVENKLYALDSDGRVWRFDSNWIEVETPHATLAPRPPEGKGE